MPWAAAITAAGAIGGAAISSDANRKAGNKQGDGAAAATAEQTRQYDLARSDQAPYREAGYGALADLVGMKGGPGNLTADQVMAEPGYQFGLMQGRNALEGSASARGGLYSGAALKALTQYGNDYGTNKYNDAFNRQESAFGNRWNRLSGLAGIGQSATNQVGQAGANYANNVGNIGLSNANAQGAAGIAQGNIWGSALNGIGSAVGGYMKTPGNNYGSGYNSGGDFNGTTGGYEVTPQAGFADGGPVRVEPKIGSKGPTRGGGGGGMSREAILAAINAAPPTAAPYGMVSLPANPVTNPGAILADRERKAMGYRKGGPIRGKGGPRDDKVPIMASNGEHMIRASAVNALGNGSNELGQQKLTALTMLLDGGPKG
jgi:hypothetical protein